MERKTQTGYLVLADISGYTSFVAQTEIEHADIALSILLEAIVEKLSGLLTISKLEATRSLPMWSRVSCRRPKPYWN